MLLAKVSQGDQRPTLDSICGPWHEEPPNLSLHLSMSTHTSYVGLFQGVSHPT